ncbi:MAG TPA: response regulator transcription factor [Nitriliruptorales bacterium]|nr:response regulator transcription factor [Nitriliruptorales bacterium]
MSATSVLVTHEHRLLRECLVEAFSAQDDLYVVAHTGDGRDAVLDAQRTSPGIVLLRPVLPRLTVTEACAAIKQAVASSRVVVMADGDDPALLLDTIEAGADGYVSLTRDLDDLLTAVRRVQRGETVVPPLLLGHMLRQLILRRRRTERTFQRFLDLTPREKEVLSLLVQGCHQETVAAELFISAQTARTHIQNLISKLGVHSRLEAAALAVTNGWLDMLPSESRNRRDDLLSRIA